MIGDQVRRWVVSVSLEEDNPAVFGPYTERKARALVEGFNEQIERGTFEGYGWLHATTYPIQNPQSVTALVGEFGEKPKRAK